MSLATRCTSCGTVFRVVQDQLKISDGWVRCGQCSEVFSALDALFELDHEVIGASARTASLPARAELSAAEIAAVTDAAPLAGDAGAAQPVAEVDAEAVAVAAANPTLPSAADFATRSINLADDAVAAVPAVEAMVSIDDVVPAVDAPALVDTDLLLPGALIGSNATEAADAAPSTPLAASAPDATANPFPQVEPKALRDAVSAPEERPIETSIAEPSAEPVTHSVDIDVDLGEQETIEELRPSWSVLRKATSLSWRRQPDFSDARFDSDSAESTPAVDTDVASIDEADLRELAREPDFLRRAERAGRWRSRPARVGVALLSAVAGVALGAQVTHHFRDEAAARWPALRPALQAWCGVAGCVVGAPRAIDDILVESTTLTQGDSADAFKLAIVLRSRGRVALRMPSVSLSLTDLNGKLISRKVLSPADFRVPSVIAPGAEAAMKATLSARNAHVTGYTVETFYP